MEETHQSTHFWNDSNEEMCFEEENVEIKIELPIEEPQILEADPLDDNNGNDSWNMETETVMSSKEDPYWRPFEEFFICPYCHLTDSGSQAKKMDFVELYYHLIFHHDFPLKCLECKLFFPRDLSKLNTHWGQFHSSNVATPVDKRYIETDVIMDISDDKQPEGKNLTPIICPNCLKDEDLEMKFDSMKKFKIHQAVKHPSVARSSCPLCPLEFGDSKAESIEHFKTAHRVYPRDFWRSYLCQFCGKAMQNAPELMDFQEAEKKWVIAGVLHLLSTHLDLLVKVSFECRICGRKYPTFKEFMEHGKNARDKKKKHSAVNWDCDTDQLFNLINYNTLACGLCRTFRLKGLNEFLIHLTWSHSLLINWNSSGPLDVIRSQTKFNWKSTSPFIDGMAEFCSVFEKWGSSEDKLQGGNTPGKYKCHEKIAKIARKVAKKAKEKPEINKVVAIQILLEVNDSGEYKCSNCPDLVGMNLDAFLVHLIFHWRRPNRCTLCRAYLPSTSEAIEEHWSVHHIHNDSETLPEVKVELVQPCPGKVFVCQKCPLKFNSDGERNDHELSSHECESASNENCGVCNEGFRNTEELRIHRALDHPEVASVSCYYCEEKFPAELREGGQYLDCEALNKHILEKEDHLKESKEKKLIHLIPCDYCGMVIEDDYKNCWLVRAHVLKHHGPVAGKSMPISCYICNCNLNQPYDSLWKHLSTEHAKNGKCETCGEEMNPRELSMHNLVKHDILMEGYERFSCDREGCVFKTVSKNSYKCHAGKHRTEDHRTRYKCDICGKGFEHASGLQAHEKVHQKKQLPPTKKKRLHRTANVEVMMGTTVVPRKSYYAPRQLWPHERRMKSRRGRKKKVVNKSTEGPKIIEEERSSEGVEINILREGNITEGYKCPNCPDLKEMSLDAFLVHLIFHWRRPNRCTKCKVYLPSATDAIDEHWSIHHNVKPSWKSMVKCELVEPCPGEVFSCQICPLKFTSHGERKEHELSSPECVSTKTKSCDGCSESFMNTVEVRIHKALDHPEIASVSCYYCEENFPADSLEGGQYLDCEALHKHIQQKDDHPEETKEKKLHLIPCDHCGMVIEDDYKFSKRVRVHVLKEHGPVAGKYKPISCYICNCSLPYDGLWKHLSTEHVKNCKCETCGEEMNPRKLPNHKLYEHDITMEGYERFSCDRAGCGFKTLTLIHYKCHASKHCNGDRPMSFKCYDCERGFSSSKALKIHQRVHRKKELLSSSAN